jgi:hypothetical protein
MPKIRYIKRKFQSKALDIICKANDIINEYQQQGYELTLRQLYYQFVARGFIPNTPKDYFNLGCTINNARLAGLIDWEAIVDRSRKTTQNQHWDSPQEIIEVCAKQYKIDTRASQPCYIEVWVEKEALAGVVERVCRKLDVLSFACIGYVSQSMMWEASQRICDEMCWPKKEYMDGGARRGVIIHLGDHDPSGIDMTRDIRDRLHMFGAIVEVKRIALTMAQIKKYKPPPNPAKTTDSRHKDYIRKFGDKSWELDALEPSVLDKLIDTEVRKLTDIKKWNILRSNQTTQRARLQSIADNYNELMV